MKRLLTLAALGMGLAIAVFAQVPVVDSIDPAEGKPGAVIGATGVYLDSSKVSAVYLTDGINDIQVTLLEQKPQAMKFKVPADAKAGVYNIMLATTTKPPLLLVQPVKYTVLHTEVE